MGTDWLKKISALILTPFGNSTKFVPQGHPDNSPRFQPWVSDAKTAEPRRGERNPWAKCARVLSSLTGLVPFSPENPAINRRAILFRPAGLPKVHAIVAQRVAEAPEFSDDVGHR